MPQSIRLWEITEGLNLSEIPKGHLNLEERLEDWLEKDISIVSNDLMIIGRQVLTDFGGYIDLLCLSRDGELVIVELKRDKTPRDIVAQVLDYASWIRELTNQRITDIADDYFASTETKTLVESYEKRFDADLPEKLGIDHRMYIVASEMDGSTERILNYLSTFGIAINALKFDYFKQGNKEYLAKVFLIEPSLIEQRQRESGSKYIPLSEEELEQRAAEHGVGELYQQLSSSLMSIFNGHHWTTKSSLAFLDFKEDGQPIVVLSLIPGRSDSEHGIKFQVYFQRFVKCFGLDESTALDLLPLSKKEWKYGRSPTGEYSGFEGFFDSQDVDKFLEKLEVEKQRLSSVPKPNS